MTISKSHLYVVAVVSAILVSAGALSLSSFAVDNPTLGTALLLDFVLTPPLVYAIAVWFGIAPAKGIKWVFAIGALAAFMVLPDSGRWLLNSVVPFVLPAFEIGLVAFVGYGLWQALRRRDRDADRYTVIQGQISKAVGTGVFARILGSELAAMVYALRPGPIPDATKAGTFSTHQTSGFRAILGALVGVTMLELVVVHILVHLASPIAAWILTGISMFTLLTVIGHIRALSRRPHLLQDGQLTLRNGLFGTLSVPMGDITLATKIDGYAKTDTPRFAILGEMEAANVHLEFARPVTYHVSHGVHRTMTSLLCHMDDPEAFLLALDGQRP